MTDLFVRDEQDQKWKHLAQGLADEFKEKAKVYDETRDFPFEHYERLVETGYTKLTVPKEFGGEGLSLYQMVMIQETLAQGDQAVTLGIGWHLGLMMDLGIKREWRDETLRQLFKDVVENGAIINRAATEPSTGSPSRGGKPQTTAKKTDSGWVLNGHKTFTTLAPLANPLIVNASIEGTDEVAGFLIYRGTEGVTIEPTWNTLSMRATRSDDLFLKDVFLPLDAKVDTVNRPASGPKPSPGWLLHIPACYLGIAQAAKRDVIAFTRTYQPNTLPHPISEVPQVREKVAEIELLILQARTMLYQTAELWDRYPEKRPELGPLLMAAKTTITNNAVKAVDLVMRIVGGQSLYESLPFERYYRDVRAGLHNPPSDDATMRVLAGQAYASN
ncbi:acyl-CoA/acyl-ACP dehydrogenase [Pullulanibacillus sp. KACC 23026]|uniref:acyl-CoA dehydrogenase family protein n=1 Tax=Pullulanibacillus sp. KACC 23026 TaxID=3028315 RepID=UPI0023AECB8C|nr:acyl-CoA dehydrogenase family protein [Pullulanibacillus sp. KACC 23026]WEG10864.1 acyl-CoA/acyl-ACP dehydrogenase [Pullulanibacillus sp. KACC 23026]